MRCLTCKKKLPLSRAIRNTCRCKKIYCSKHIMKHPCSFNYKQEMKKNLRAEMPVIEREKILFI